MYSHQRNTYRRVILKAWHKAQQGEALEGLEAQIVSIIRHHPEYHALFADPKEALSREGEDLDSNPFLHLGLHLAVLEQLSIDQPPGIRALYQALLARLGDPHQVEHRIMDCLAKLIWRARGQGAMLEHAFYLDCIRRLL